MIYKAGRVGGGDRRVELLIEQFQQGTPITPRDQLKTKRAAEKEQKSLTLKQEMPSGSDATQSVP